MSFVRKSRNSSTTYNALVLEILSHAEFCANELCHTRLKCTSMNHSFVQHHCITCNMWYIVSNYQIVTAKSTSFQLRTCRPISMYDFLKYRLERQLIGGTNTFAFLPINLNSFSLEGGINPYQVSVRLSQSFPQRARGFTPTGRRRKSLTWNIFF